MEPGRIYVGKYFGRIHLAIAVSPKLVAEFTFNKEIREYTMRWYKYKPSEVIKVTRLTWGDVAQLNDCIELFRDNFTSDQLGLVYSAHKTVCIDKRLKLTTMKVFSPGGEI